MSDEKDLPVDEVEEIKTVSPGGMFGENLWGDRTPDPRANRRFGLDVPVAAPRNVEVLKVP